MSWLYTRQLLWLSFQAIVFLLNLCSPSDWLIYRKHQWRKIITYVLAINCQSSWTLPVYRNWRTSRIHTKTYYRMPFTSGKDGPWELWRHHCELTYRIEWLIVLLSGMNQYHKSASSPSNRSMRFFTLKHRPILLPKLLGFRLNRALTAAFAQLKIEMSCFRNCRTSCQQSNMITITLPCWAESDQNKTDTRISTSQPCSEQH